jgi:hypothetical protein
MVVGVVLIPTGPLLISIPGARSGSGWRVAFAQFFLFACSQMNNGFRRMIIIYL